jgi:hypothetical protein
MKWFERYVIAAELSMPVVLCFATLGLARCWKYGALRGAADVLLAITAPCVAWVLFVITSCSYKSLLGKGGLRFPLNITVPAVMAAFVGVVGQIIVRTDASLTTISERYAPASIWTDWNLILVGCVASIAALSSWIALRKDRSEPANLSS